MVDNGGEMVARERAAWCAWWLTQGRALSTRQVADRTGLTMKEANELLKSISRVIPIYKEGKIWRICEK